MLHHEAKAAEAFPIYTTHGKDFMAWAKRLNHRFENGDKTLMPVQITFARMALGIIPFPGEQK